MFGGVFGFCLANEGPAAGTEVGELPKAGEAFHKEGGQPGAEEAAGDGKTPT